jgi:hypothetical protein
MAETGSKSKTLSDQSSNSKLLDPPAFFLDRALGKRKVADALRAKAGVAVFVLTSGNLTGDEMATAFVTALPRMQKLLSSLKPPFIAKVTRSGIVTLLGAPKHHGRRRE